ncbi:MAG: DUF3800 domain-containing protein [Candidatus Acidiferrales bacterium]
MYVCYVDESGTPEIPGNTTHFVLAGISIPIRHWRSIDRSISTLLKRYGLSGAEFHTAWILRKYLEQTRIPGFDNLDWNNRRIAVEHQRNKHLLQLQKTGPSTKYRQVKKNYTETKAYVHLTLTDRRELVAKVADLVSKWTSARLFAECIDKLHFSPALANCTADQQAFEQLVSRFEQYLVNTEKPGGNRNYGMLVHDNNETVAKKHTALDLLP